MLCNLQGAGFIMGSKVGNFTFVVVIFPIVMLSRRFGFFLNLVMHGYACGKHNINLKETFIWGTSDVLQMERKTYKVKWSIGS